MRLGCGGPQSFRPKNFLNLPCRSRTPGRTRQVETLPVWCPEEHGSGRWSSCGPNARCCWVPVWWKGTIQAATADARRIRTRVPTEVLGLRSSTCRNQGSPCPLLSSPSLFPWHLHMLLGLFCHLPWKGNLLPPRQSNVVWPRWGARWAGLLRPHCNLPMWMSPGTTVCPNR